MSRIIDHRPALFGSVDLDSIIEKIDKYYEDYNKKLEAEGRFPRLSSQGKMKFELIEFVEKVIVPCLITGRWNLDLSDSNVCERMNVSERRAKQLRLKLKEMDIIFFPPNTKQKKVGDYPLWMLRKDFINFKKREYKKSERDLERSKYIPLFWEYYNLACQEVYVELEERDWCLSIQSFIVEVWAKLDEILVRENTSRDQLLKVNN